MNQLLEKGDIVALKDGREVEILSVKKDGDEVRRFDFVDRAEASPMRRTEYPSIIVRVIRKSSKPIIDPKSVRPYDNPVVPPQPVVIVNADANPQVNPAAINSPKPVTTRRKTK